MPSPDACQRLATSRKSGALRRFSKPQQVGHAHRLADLAARLVGEGKARETIRKSITTLAMVLDFAGISPNPARDRVQADCRARSRKT